MLLSQQKLLYYSLDPNITPGQVKKIDHLSPEQVQLLESPSTQKLTQRMEKHHITGDTQEMETYPFKLSHIKNPPHLFYALGNLDLLNRPTLGIVWPREMSPYADKVMEALFQQLHPLNLVTISGLARGVDQKCHQLSLQHHLPTIAILWGGLRRYLRSSAKNLIETIVTNGGLVLSEFKLDFKPTKRSFPQRNRIIAGISDLLFLPEAREGSGSLITANFALEMKKEIFVAPNQLFSSNGLGSNQLISTKQVQVLTDFQQIVKKFTKHWKNASWIPNSESSEIIGSNLQQSLSPEEKNLIQLVHLHAYKELSQWKENTSLEFSDLLSQLTLLEMKGLISQSSPGCYVTN